MKWIVIILLVIVMLIAIVFLIGYFLPAHHTASVTVYLNKSPEKIWGIITDYKNYTAWRRGLKSVVVTDKTHWSEVSDHGTIKYEAEVFEPYAHFVSRIKNDDLPFSGAWFIELKPDHEQTEVTITEKGEVKNPIFRFMSKYIFGHKTTLRNYANDLEKRCALN